MSADMESAAPNLNLNADEKRTYGQLFRQADTDNVGVVTGEIAVKFFEKTRLDSRILGEIWQIADKENRGFLTPAGFGIALRLIAHAQAGREPTTELAFQPGNLPQFEGLNLPPSAPPPASAPLQAQMTGGARIAIPPLTPEKVSQYANLFERQNLQTGGLLPGDQAKNIFEKSGLPNEVLGRIWQLADTEQRGALVTTEFVIAMHLLTSMKSGTLRGLPSILPAGLYEAATRRSPAPRQSPTATGPMSAIPRQLSGQAQVRAGSPLGRQPPITSQPTGLSPQMSGSAWLVTPADKARFDQFFADLDKSNRGFITGGEAVPFLSQSSLPEDALAQIWDLADIKSEGQLNKDTFAVAMYLIRQQRSRRDMPLPQQLPPNLIPPSMRNQPRPSAPGPSPFDDVPPVPPLPQQPPAPPPPVFEKPKSALDDLFGLDAAASPAPIQQPLPTGESASKDPFAGGAPTSPAQTSPAPNTFKPFIPSSSFGRSLAIHDTGGSSGSGQGRPINSGAADDLLGDADPEQSKKITNESTELANLSNQVGSLSKEMQTVQGQRNTTQAELSQASEQKKNFEQRLSQLRALYEKEAQDVRALEEQLKKVRDETRKLTGEMVTIDGTYQDLQKQRQELAAALHTDQQENANLKQRISATNTEIAQLKPQIEKLKSDARQQKGMVAINKKQLSTVEGERDRLQGEKEDLTKSNDELSRQTSASSPSSTPAQVSSPAPSTASANNPFFRRTGSTDIMGAFASPAPKPYGDKSFDDIFGSFAPGSGSGTPPPVTSFKEQNTGTSTASAGSFNTPTGSTPTISRPPTTTTDLPPPPESKQLNSSNLPFGDPAASLSSSRQVSPPVSRAGDIAAAPSSGIAQPEVPAVSTSEAEREQAENHSSGAVPGAFPSDTPGATPIEGKDKTNRESDPFGGMTGSADAKADFDSAFASFKPQDKPKESTGGQGFSNFNSEFPPISELERDDESDSDSDSNRFDDDFGSASPAAKKTDSQDVAPSSPAATKATAGTGAPTTGGPSNPSQASKYGDPLSLSAYTSGSSHKNTNLSLSDLSAFPEPPKSSPSLPPPVAASSKEDDPFAPTTTSTNNTTPTASKGAFDDPDDDFEGLEDAKEGSADDDFANISRSNLSDFNPVFDSSPPPSQPKSESTNVSNAFGNESSYDFGNVSTTSAATAGGAGASSLTSATTTTATKPSVSENHDWDAIFASLDSPSAAANPAPLAEENKSPVLSQASDKLERPGPVGRALTEEGKHDDPIVKNLTSMGYSRADSINALEKYDYNLERAANYLASQS